MNWLSLLFFITLAEAIAAWFIYFIYNHTFYPDVTLKYMARILAYVVPINLVLLFLIEKISNSFGMFFMGAGAAGKNLYSYERGLARNGDREAACQALEEAIKRRGDVTALRLLIEIATDQPVMHLWMSRASGLKGKLKNPTREDLAGFDMMLSRMRKTETKEKAAFF